MRILKVLISVSKTCFLLLSIGYHSFVFSHEKTNFSDLNPIIAKQQAADFTHLKWFETLNRKVSIQLFPIVNYSGKPIASSNDDNDVFYHGDLSSIMNSIYRDAFLASRYFMPVVHSPDYRLQLILDEYQPPYDTVPKNKTIVDYIKRNKPAFPQSQIKLTAKLFSGQKKIQTWMSTIEVNFSDCELNNQPQPQTWRHNYNIAIKEYLSTASGQGFLAATNHLLLKIIQRINQKPLLARIEHKSGNDIHLLGQSNAFTRGETLEVFSHHQQMGQSAQSLGKIQIIKTTQNRAIAYPVSLRADHLITGDWVELNRKLMLDRPASVFVAANSCGKQFMPVLPEEAELAGL